MDGNNVSSDHVIAELIDMGFEFEKALKAVEAVGPCLKDTVEFILNGSSSGNSFLDVKVPSLPICSTGKKHPLDRKVMPLRSSVGMKQSNIMDHLQSSSRTKRRNIGPSVASFSGVKRCKSEQVDDPVVSRIEPTSELFKRDSVSHSHQTELKVPLHGTVDCQPQDILRTNTVERHGVESDWDRKVSGILQKHFGFSSLKGFQKEALEAWSANRDCLVLAATGSGKSLCFQIPAVLTGKVVVVISPLISLMHDQCLKLAKHGISACFLGSGQPDRSVESKAMSGMYNIVYICPETVIRLTEPLKKLAEDHGIALFAIDEVHCVSKWGHDFRPDYRRLSILRENFSARNLKSLKFNIPLMALTATATIPVRDDILKSLLMSKETKIVLTSFFRPNLRFSVKHSRTSSPPSYNKDFHDLIKTYSMSRVKGQKGFSNCVEDFRSSSRVSDDTCSDADETSPSNSEDDDSDGNDIDACVANENSSVPSDGDQLTIEYLEDEVDIHETVDDLDVSCGEFPGNPSPESSEYCQAPKLFDPQHSLQEGCTIIYVPTRKETIKIPEYLCRSGIRAAAYHAKLPKTHLRRVHEDFHRNSLEVVVATIAFGMGIDKSNVRRIIHYGWPQSLEAYYQEAGRAGRDGKLSDCTLYANLSRIPTLLPNRRSEEQTKQAYKMLADCFRYGMNTASCRAKILVEYFGEEFGHDRCNLCDVCCVGPPKVQNLVEEADSFMCILKPQRGNTSFGYVSNCGAIYGESCSRPVLEKPNFKMIVSRIREQFQKFSASDQLWWRGLARILEDKGFIREGKDMPRVAISYPELTELGLKFLNSKSEKSLYAYPEGDMLLSVKHPKPYSTFSEWGRGWADPEIRRQCLGRMKGRSRTRKKKKKSRQFRPEASTARGRLAAKLFIQKP